MKLTKSVDYALRIVICLAQDQTPKTMKEMTASLHIPYNNLMKLVQRMSKSRLLVTKQGKGGGIELGVDPALITLKDVIRVIDGPLELSQCQDGHSHCVLENCCQLRQVFSEMQDKIDAIFESVSIADIAVKQAALTK